MNMLYIGIIILINCYVKGMRASGGGQGAGPNVIRILPRDITVFLQGPPMQVNVSCMILFIIQVLM